MIAPHFLVKTAGGTDFFMGRRRWFGVDVNGRPTPHPMKARLRKLAHRFIGDERAPSAIEYALLAAGVGVLIIAVVYMLGGGARSAFERATPPEPTTTTTSSSAPP